MARGRMINKTVATDRALADLGKEVGPWALVFHHRIIAFLDVNGNVRASKFWLKDTIFPHDSGVSPEDCGNFAGKLPEYGLAIAYESDGIEYLHFCSFKKNQIGLRIDKVAPEFPEYLQAEEKQYDGKFPESSRNSSGKHPANIREHSRTNARASEEVEVEVEVEREREVEEKTANATSSPIPVSQNGHHPTPDPDPIPIPVGAQHAVPASSDSAFQDFSVSQIDVPDQIVAIMHDIGKITGYTAFQNISAYSWRPDLLKHGTELGFACILNQAQRFKQWFLGQVEAGKIKSAGKPNPRSRFFNNWLARVKPEEKTTGDQPMLQPPEPNEYERIMDNALKQAGVTMSDIRGV